MNAKLFILNQDKALQISSKKLDVSLMYVRPSVMFMSCDVL
jgi:hypothetical protein